MPRRHDAPPEPVPSDIGDRLAALDAWVAHHESTLEALKARLDRAADAVETLALVPARLDSLTIAVAEGISHVERAEARVRATVARARRELADRDFESPGVEAEAAELRLVHGEGGDPGELPAVRPDVARAQPSRQELLRERLRELKLSS